jgi:hypothetical protein
VAEEARMSRPDEGLIHQWLDGECTPEESARLEQLVATDPDWAAAVAEARGLIAASSRIVGALDAVPRAMPTGSVAAPPSQDALAAKRHAPRRRLPAWAGMAAAVVLVAGTAYVLRERSMAPFETPAASLPAATPATPVTPVTTATTERDAGGSAVAVVTRDPRSIQPPTTVPALEPAPAADRVRAEAIRGAEAGVAAASGERVQVPTAALASAPPPAPSPATSPASSSAPLAPVKTTLARRAEPERILDSPNSISIVTATRVLAGCWRVSAPPELAGTLVNPAIRRASGDTLVLVTLRGEVHVTRNGDRLQGGLEALSVPCEPELPR